MLIKVPSKSRPGLSHEVRFLEEKWSCSCEHESFDPGGECKHIKFVKSKMEKKLEPNEYLAQISGKFPVEGNFEIDDIVKFVGEGQVVKTERESRQDGTFDFIIKVKPTKLELQHE